MNQFLKQAYYMGAQQALEDLGLPGLDLDSLLQEARDSLSAAGGGSAGDAGSVAQAAVGNSPDDAYSLLGSLAPSKQAAYGDELSDSPYSLGLGVLGLLGGAAVGTGIGGRSLLPLIVGSASGATFGRIAGDAIDKHNYNSYLLSRLRQGLGLEEEA